MKAISTNRLRNIFAEAMSEMYQNEVPQYGELLKIVTKVNELELTKSEKKSEQIKRLYSCNRIAKERHGAIRVGTAEELNNLRRLFALFGMYPVAYYDLSVAGIPVHSTAFRPISDSDLSANPFRIFTSLLRIDLIEDRVFKRRIESQLGLRKIFSKRLIDLIEHAENQAGISVQYCQEFISEAIEVFRWHNKAMVDVNLYNDLHSSHGLIADIVAFRGPHINHLTPATLNIETVQKEMSKEGLKAKAVIEGPPKRNCPILLRQTSFKALQEPILFPNTESGFDAGSHTARFGEIEQRGVALTPKGMALYTKLLMTVRQNILPKPDGSNSSEYTITLAEGFQEFPDNYQTLRESELAYFKYSIVYKQGKPPANLRTLNDLVENNYISFDPIIYEDFLPVSAAGIFQSNLDGSSRCQYANDKSIQREFEKALGTPVINQFSLYQSQQDSSIEECLNYYAR